MNHQIDSKLLRSGRVILFGITAMTGYQIIDGLIAARYVRSVNSRIPLVWGGAHPTLEPEQTVQDDLVDIVVVGQGERTLLELAQTPWAPQRDKGGIAGLCQRLNGHTVKSPRRPPESLANFEPMPYDILDVNNYVETYARRVYGPHSRIRLIRYVSARGCPFECRFCTVPWLEGKELLALSPERVVDDLAKLSRDYCINHVHFSDSEFFLNRARTLRIAELLIRNRVAIRWMAQSRVSTVDKFTSAELDTLKRSGLSYVELGLESGSQRILNYIGKRITAESAMAVARKFAAAGLGAKFNFIFGFPNELESDRAASFRMAAELKQTLPGCVCTCFFFVPYPGTALLQDSVAHGFTVPRSLREWGEREMEMVRLTRTVPWLSVTEANLIHRRMMLYRIPSRPGVGQFLLTQLARLRTSVNFYDLPFEWWVTVGYQRFGRAIRHVLRKSQWRF